MRKFLIFIVFLVLLIISEYFLVSELFSNQRITVMLISLLCSVAFIYAAYRFFKKYLLNSKQSEAHS